ncbi:hypothetical protein D7V93_34980, partial [Corallococcus llansteffanensis]
MALGAAPASSAIPLPGATASRSAAIPLPGSSAPPVPSEDPFSFDDEFPSTPSASPGVAAPRAISLDAGPASPVPLPEDSFSFDMGAEPPQAAASMAAEDDFAEVGSGEFSSLDTGDFTEREDVTRVVRIPVPTDAYREPVAYGSQEPASTARDFDFSEAPVSAPVEAGSDFGSTPDFDFAEQDAAPVPAPAEDAFTFDINDPSNAHGPAASHPQTFGYGSEPPADAFAMAPPSSEPEADPFGLPPPSDYAQASVPDADPFALPPPPESGPGAYDLGSLPTSGEDPFALPPSPGMDFSDLPSPASSQA